MDVNELVSRLDAGRAEFSNAALDLFVSIVPEARRWNDSQKKVFIDQASGRFAAILAIVNQGSIVDEALVDDLSNVGSTSFDSGASLTHLLLVLRISRDLLVENAIPYMQENVRANGEAVSSFLSRLVPAVDNMVDAISYGFWSQKFLYSQESVAQIEALVNRTEVPMYEADVDGVIRLANEAFCGLVQLPSDAVQGSHLADIVPVDISSGSRVDLLLAEPPGDSAVVPMNLSGDFGEVEVHVSTVVRRDEHGSIVGFCGAFLSVPDGASEKIFDPSSDLATNSSSHISESALEFVEELRRATNSLRDAGDFLESRSEDVNSGNVKAVARAISNQADRMLESVDGLDEVLKNAAVRV